MKLTSRNMAVKALNAKGCLSDMVTRMWDYLEEGDVDNAHCAREKALLLMGLIETIERWKPTIVSGNEKSYTATIISGDFTFPVYVKPMKVNGINVSGTVHMYSGTNADVMKAISNSINCFLSSDDDVLQVYSGHVEDSLSISINGELSMFPVSVDLSPSIFQSIVLEITETEEVAFENMQPHCLTNEQILTVIKKIDELCENKC